MNHDAISVAILLGAVLTLAPRALQAQGRSGSVELGFDAGVEFSNVEDLDVDGGEVEFGDRTRVGIPIQRFRVGYHASDLISVEPSIGLNYDKVEDPRNDSDEGDVSRTDLQLGLAALIHFRRDPDNPVAYGVLRGTYNLTDLNAGGDELDNGDSGNDSVSQFGAAAGIGVKLPVADRLDVRLEGAYERRFEHESDLLPASNNYQLNVGFSWYTGRS